MFVFRNRRGTAIKAPVRATAPGGVPHGTGPRRSRCHQPPLLVSVSTAITIASLAFGLWQRHPSGDCCRPSARPTAGIQPQASVPISSVSSNPPHVAFHCPPFKLHCTPISPLLRCFTLAESTRKYRLTKDHSKGLTITCLRLASRCVWQPALFPSASFWWLHP